MDPFRGIVVQVISDGQSLKLYDDPDAGVEGHSEVRQQYVEAVTGKTFKIKVMLTAEFELYDLQFEEAVEIGIMIDGTATSRRNHRIHREDFGETFPVERIFSGASNYCSDTGQWLRADYSFGLLELVDESANDNPSLDQIENIGSIQLQIRKVRVKKRSVPKTNSLEADITVNHISEKALKGKAIVNSVHLANSRPASPPGPILNRYSKISGPGGQELSYKILYRSRTALQMIGCIPRSPSPVVELLDENASVPVGAADMAAEQAQREILDLRVSLFPRPKSMLRVPFTFDCLMEFYSIAYLILHHNMMELDRVLTPHQARLAQLEGENNVKNEPATGVKREHNEGENANPRSRPRKSVKIETIDLTDD